MTQTKPTKRYFCAVDTNGRHVLNNSDLPVWEFDGKSKAHLYSNRNVRSTPDSFWVQGSTLEELVECMNNGEIFPFNEKSGIQRIKVLSLEEMNLKPGQFYPRIARPHSAYFTLPTLPNHEVFEDEIARSRGQLRSLTSKLEHIFQHVHPEKRNYNTYSHEIRNLLIIACTEVEAQWKGVLRDNNYKNSKTTPNKAQNLKTSDYVILNDVMHLNEYSVKLRDYPWLESILPFEKWNPKSPTKSLAWYQAYNTVKHDGERKFENAKLIHVINALCACAVMLQAQFGQAQFKSDLFDIETLPEWPGPERYIFISQSGTYVHTSTPYPFP